MTTAYLTFPESDNYFNCSYTLLIHTTTKIVYFQSWKLFHLWQVVCYKCFSHYIFLYHSHEIKMGFTIRVFPQFRNLLLNLTITTQNITFDYCWRQDRLNYNSFGKPSVFFMNYLSHWQNFHTVVRDEGRDRSHGCPPRLPSLNKAEGGAWKLKYLCAIAHCLSY